MDTNAQMDNASFSEQSGARDFIAPISQPGTQSVVEALTNADANWQRASPSDPALQTAWRLQQRGVRLDQHWREALPNLPVRVTNVLKVTGYQTLLEVVLALQSDAKELMGKDNFGRKSLTDLWQALEQLVATGESSHQDFLFAELNEPRLTANLELPSLPQPLVARLETAGVNLDQPWQQELAVVSTRLHNALSEKFGSLREVVIAATDGILEFRKTPNLGRKTLLELQELLNKLAQNGPGCLRYGEQALPPSSVDELVAQALEVLPGKEGRLLIRRCLDGLTLEQLGQEYEVTRERIRQKVRQTLTGLNQRFGAQAQELLASLITTVNEAGGLIHRDMALSLSGAVDLRKTWLALLIAGEDSFRVWRGEFLSTWDSEEMAERLRAIRQALGEHRKKDLYLAEARDIIVQASGFVLDDVGATRLLITWFDSQVAEDGLITLGGLRLPDRLAKILRVTGHPMHISEIADAFLASSASAVKEALVEIDGEESDEDETQLASISKRELTERALAAALLRHEDIYQSGPKTFLHASALPIPLERLDEIVDLCVSRIEGEPGAVSADYLLRTLAAVGLAVQELNKFLLKSALTRHPAIISLKKFRVGHTASFQEHGLTLLNRIEAILRAADKPLSSIEVIQRLPRGIEYFPGSIGMCLAREADFAINLQGKYVHIENLGLSAAQRTSLIESAIELLPEDGTPVSCAFLLDRLHPCFAELEVAGHLDRMDVLYGLLRENERIQCSPGYLVARRVEGKEQPLVKEVILQIIRDAVVTSPREIRRMLSNTWGAVRIESSMNNTLNNVVRDGLVKRLSPALYYLADTDEEKLLEELTAHEPDLLEVLDNLDLASMSSADLWLLACCCYRQDNFVQADKLIGILQARDDLSPDQRRSCNRLRVVIQSKM